MDTDVQGFAARFREAARAKGFTSDRSHSGVDIGSVVEAIGVSYEMARRYAEGMAMPRPETVRAIADWLNVKVAWLLYGSEEPATQSDVNVVLLENCVRAVVEAQKSAGIELSTERLSGLVASLYREAEQGSDPSATSIAATLRAFAR